MPPPPQFGHDPVQRLLPEAVALHQQGQFAKAERLYRRILKAAPEHFDALHLLGVARAQQGDNAEAVRLITAALNVRPGSAEAHDHLGNALSQLGRLAEALTHHEQAIRINPRAPRALINSGTVLAELRRYDEALRSFDAALALAPGFPEALCNKGKVLLEQSRFSVEATAMFEQVLRARPGDPEALGGLAWSAGNTCDWRHTRNIAGNLAALVSTIEPFTLTNYTDDPAMQLACAQHRARRKFAMKRAPFVTRAPARREKIKIAYLSADYRRHPIANLLSELFERHDRARFEVIGVSFGPDSQSEERARLVRAFDRFEDVLTRSEQDTAKLLHDMQIDIAVDLTGMTSGGRPGILAWRPVPVQASYCGYPATTGVDFIDYTIVDAVVAPPDHQKFYSEQLVRLPETFLTFDTTRQIAPAPTRREAGLPDEGVVFCCFNNNYKITPAIFDVWMRLLASVPGSVAWLRHAPHAADNLRREAQARGVDPQRLIFAPSVERTEDHLARQGLADIFLDTLPYNAHATAVDALWAGLPIVTCQGRGLASRVASSLLGAIGMPELVTTSLADYEALALKLARDPALLQSVRQKLATNRITHPLFDADRFRRHIEQAYATMLDIAQRGSKPRGFDVPALP